MIRKALGTIVLVAAAACPVIAQEPPKIGFQEGIELTPKKRSKKGGEKDLMDGCITDTREDSHLSYTEKDNTTHWLNIGRKETPNGNRQFFPYFMIKDKKTITIYHTHPIPEALEKLAGDYDQQTYKTIDNYIDHVLNTSGHALILPPGKEDMHAFKKYQKLEKRYGVNIHIKIATPTGIFTIKKVPKNISKTWDEDYKDRKKMNKWLKRMNKRGYHITFEKKRDLKDVKLFRETLRAYIKKYIK